MVESWNLYPTTGMVESWNLSPTTGMVESLNYQGEGEGEGEEEEGVVRRDLAKGFHEGFS